MDLKNHNLSDEELRIKYGITDSRDWKLGKARQRILHNEIWETKLTDVLYRPFDKRWTYFDKTLVTYPRPLIQTNIVNKENLILCLGKQGNVIGDAEWNLVFISNLPTEKNLAYRGGIYLFPLYKYEGAFRFTNLKPEIIAKIEERTGLQMQDNADKERNEGGFLPTDLIDYIYAVLHSKEYRRRYHDFLQTDFPLVPYPANADEFFRLASIGEQLRGLHLMTSVSDDNIFTEYDVDSPKNNLVEFCRYNSETKRLYINEEQYIGKVPANVYAYNTCGYQVIDKWLKDRKGRNLTNYELRHLQKMIYAIRETIALQERL